MPTRELADKYFAAIRNRDVDALGAMFVDDGVVVLPDGRELQGVAAIHAMYAQLFAMSPPIPSPTNVIVGEEGIAVEIEARMTDGSSRNTANFFQLDASGRIRRMNVYRRG